MGELSFLGKRLLLLNEAGQSLSGDLPEIGEGMISMANQHDVEPSPDRLKPLKDRIDEAAEWTNTTIRTWAIFDENGLPLFVQPPSEDRKNALGAISALIATVVSQSRNYGVAIRMGTFELEMLQEELPKGEGDLSGDFGHRDKLHHFNVGDYTLLIITKYRISGEERFLKHISERFDSLEEALLIGV
jgi:hypothetical protein